MFCMSLVINNTTNNAKQYTEVLEKTHRVSLARELLNVAELPRLHTGVRDSS